MKRLLVIGCLASVSIITVFASCGKPPEVCDIGYYLDAPQLCPDRASLGFGLEFRTGTFIGRTVSNTIDVRNGGTTDLVVSAAARTGDNAFSSDVIYDLPDGGSGTTLPATIPGGKHLFLRVFFAPTQAKAYSGLLTVQSNSGPESIKKILDGASAAGATPVVTANQGLPAGSFAFLLAGCGVPEDGGTSPCYLDGGTP